MREHASKWPFRESIVGGNDREFYRTREELPDAGGDELWVIERIVRQEKRGRSQGYVVKWKGYKESTWEPAKRLVKDVPELVKRFEAQRGKS